MTTRTRLRWCLPSGGWAGRRCGRPLVRQTDEWPGAARCQQGIALRSVIDGGGEHDHLAHRRAAGVLEPVGRLRWDDHGRARADGDLLLADAALPGAREEEEDLFVLVLVRCWPVARLPLGWNHRDGRGARLGADQELPHAPPRHLVSRPMCSVDDWHWARSSPHRKSWLGSTAVIRWQCT